MAALTGERTYKTRAGGTHRFETYAIAAAQTIYNGALVAFDAAGYIVPAATTAGILVCGVAQSTVVNATGGAGDKSVLVMTGCRVNFVNATAGAAITRAHYGRLVYALDDLTITNAAGIVAGVCDLIDTDGVWVFVDMAVNAAAQAAIA